MVGLRHISLFLLCLCAAPLTGQTDTTLTMREVLVTSRLTYREVMSGQSLKGDELQRLSHLSVADALRYFSGVQLKDYGGVGGVKTVDVRSMGTNHLSVSYDGIALGNAQNGQTDLGQLSLDNVEEVSLFNGQKSAIFQSAGDFASASSVYIRTRRPRFDASRRSNTRLKARYGAFDLLRLSALYERRLSDSLLLSVNGEVLTSSGKYRFRYHRVNADGTTAWDTTATRQNGDLRSLRFETNLYGTLFSGAWQAKGYVYHSRRGIPGAIVNNVWRRGERQGDLNAFVQGQWQKSIGNVFSTKWQAKYAYYRTHYVNNDSTLLPVDNLYRQQEALVTTANVVELLPSWSASLSYDFKCNMLSADTYRFARPTRISNALSLATAVERGPLKAQASMVCTSVHDRTHPDGLPSASNSITRFTPAVFVSLCPLAPHPTTASPYLCLRTFVKRSFRMPTFNDLYYTDMGNASLRPESATQFDIGIVASRSASRGIFAHAGIQADIYYNRVSDKIIAYPKGQQFRWTMLNLGRVDIRGLDVVAEATVRLSRKALSTVRAQYTWQRSIDVSDSEKTYYRHQIPYIPRHSGSVAAGLECGRLTLNYSFIYTGERWNEQENTAYNHVQPWYTSDLSASWTTHLGGVKMRLSAEVNNLMDQQYDVISNYPMPGRNAAVGVEVTL